MILPQTLETIILILAAFFPFYWTNQTYLSKFSLQLAALLMLIFIFHGLVIRKKASDDPVRRYQNITAITIITIITVTLVLTSGGAASALFFVLDFLLFFVAVLFRPGAALTLSLALIIGFLLNEPELTQTQLINLISLLLMAPLAVFFSTQYRQVIMDKIEIKKLSDQAENIEQSALIWLALDFRQQIEKLIDLLSQISVPYYQKERLNQLCQDIKALWRSGQELEKKIDEAGE